MWSLSNSSSRFCHCQFYESQSQLGFRGHVLRDHRTRQSERCQAHLSLWLVHDLLNQSRRSGVTVRVLCNFLAFRSLLRLFCSWKGTWSWDHYQLIWCLPSCPRCRLTRCAFTPIDYHLFPPSSQDTLVRWLRISHDTLHYRFHWIRTLSWTHDQAQ